MIVIAAAILITCAVIYREKDWGYSIVVLWALLGIILKRSTAGDAPAVLMTAAAGMVLITVFYALRRLVLK